MYILRALLNTNVVSFSVKKSTKMANTHIGKRIIRIKLIKTIVVGFSMRNLTIHQIKLIFTYCYCSTCLVYWNLYSSYLQVTYMYVVFWAHNRNMCFSYSPNISSNVRLCRFHDITINIRTHLTSCSQVSTKNVTSLNPKPLFHGYLVQFQNMNFQTWGNSKFPYIITCYAFLVPFFTSLPSSFLLLWGPIFYYNEIQSFFRYTFASIEDYYSFPIIKIVRTMARHNSPSNLFRQTLYDPSKHNISLSFLSYTSLASNASVEVGSNFVN